MIPEAQAWDYLLNHNHRPETYREAMWGAYRGFLDNGLQPDWVHIDHIADYDTIYAPYPIMLTAEHAKALAAWVEKGGTLISEATPGYFGDRGKVGTVQPHNGLDVVFGVRESEVEFMPDIGDRIRFTFDGAPVGGGGFLQSYTATTGKPRGAFSDGRLAVVENTHGKGRTLLVGTHPGVAYFKTSSAENLSYFAMVFEWTGRSRHLTIDNSSLLARLHRGPGGGAIYVLNPTRSRTEGDDFAWRRSPAAQGRRCLLGDGWRPNSSRASARCRDPEAELTASRCPPPGPSQRVMPAVAKLPPMLSEPTLGLCRVGTGHFNAGRNCEPKHKVEVAISLFADVRSQFWKVCIGSWPCQKALGPGRTTIDRSGGSDWFVSPPHGT